VAIRTRIGNINQQQLSQAKPEQAAAPAFFFVPDKYVHCFMFDDERCTYSQQNVPWLDTYSKVLDVLLKGA